MLCEKFGDYCLDLSKLIFGGVILAAIMQLDINTVWLFVVGTVIVALVVIIWGTRELRKDASKDNPLWLLPWLYLCGFVKANPPFRASPEKRFGCILFVLSNKIMGLIYFISAFGILMLVGIIGG